MANTETSVSNLKINRLTQTQLENASSLSNTEAYWVDPEFTGGKVLATDSNGDIVETTVAPADIGTVKSVNSTSPDSNGNVALTIPTVNNPTITITQGGTTKGSFTLNQSSGDTIALDAGGGTVTSVNNVSPVSGNVTLSADNVLPLPVTPGSVMLSSGTDWSPTRLVAGDIIDAVDINDCAQIYPVIETYVSGTSWYRIYSDGWCEQGGEYTTGDGAKTIQLLKSYKNADYFVSFMVRYDTADGTYLYYPAIGTAYTTSFFRFTTHYAYGGAWMACGYLADAEYTGGTYKAYKP